MVEMPAQEGGEQPQYSQQDLDNQVLNYMSQKLNREIKSFEDFNRPQINESVDVINRFVQRQDERQKMV